MAAAPPLPRETHEVDDEAPIPRRSKNYIQRSYWWRPRSTFGQILLGTAAVVVVSALIFVGVEVRRFLLRDIHFRIPGALSITSTGLSEVSRAELLPVFGEDIGRNIFFVPLEARRKQLEAIPWVKQATVMRFLPDQLSVSIVERTPVAFVRQGQSIDLADADGVILSMPPAMLAQHHYSFPVIIGIDPRDSLAARRTRMLVYQRFVAELDQNQAHQSELVSEIDLSDPEDLRATMPEQGADILAHFGEGHFLERLGVYKAHVAEWRQRYPRLKGVDLRYSGEVPLEMAGANDDGGTVATAERKPAIPVAVESSKPAAHVAAIPVDPPIKTMAAKAKTPTHASASQTPAARKVEETHKSADARKRAAHMKAAKAELAKGHANHSLPTHPTVQP